MDLEHLRAAAPLNRQPARIRIGPAMLFAALAVALLLFLLDGKTALQYRRAEKAAMAGNFEQARQSFGRLASRHYKDAEAWQHYCMANIALENGRPGEARRLMNKAFFHHLNEEQAAFISDFRKSLDANAPQSKAA